MADERQEPEQEQQVTQAEGEDNAMRAAGVTVVEYDAPENGTARVLVDNRGDRQWHEVDAVRRIIADSQTPELVAAVWSGVLRHAESLSD